MTQADTLLRWQDHKGGVEDDNKEQVLLPPHLFKEWKPTNFNLKQNVKKTSFTTEVSAESPSAP